MATLKATPKRVTAKSTGKKVSGPDSVTHTFSDGTKFEGTYEKLEKVASALGEKIITSGKTPRGFYQSETKGLVKISSMNDHHIRRALLKRSKDYFAEVYGKDDSNKVFLRKYTGLTSDQTVQDLYTELAKRP